MTGDVPHIDPDKWRPSPWRPIETAPKDGTRILGCAENGSMFVCHWYQWPDDWVGVWLEHDEHIVKPTHYMPLPEPPKG